jgi:hypothetical protein
MAAPKKAQQTAPITKKPRGDEVVPDAWERFRTAVHVMTKAGPQHRKSKLKGAEEPKKAKRKVKAGPRL